MNFEDTADKEEFDSKSLINFLFRNKKIISFVSVFSFFLGLIYSFTIKKTWEGQFRIVYEVSNSRGINNLGLGSTALGKIAGLDEKQVPLKTEVSILNSPSVLMPIYKFSTADKRDNLYTDEFLNWKKNLTITKERSTNVIAVFYRDQNKKNIIPVLEKIRNSYQEYSGRRERRTQELSIKYLKNQISLFKIKSSDSLRDAQEYASNQEIFLNKTPIFVNRQQDNGGLVFQEEGITPVLGPKMKSGSVSNLKKNINIEQDRAKAVNDIRIINSLLKKIEKINDPEQSRYISSILPSIKTESLYLRLEKLENELAERRSIYTNEDQIINRILDKRINLFELLKKRSINELNAARLVAESRLEASTRPKGVLLKYKELVRNAERDESTLINLENELRSIELEQAKIKDPWEVITKPTIYSYPVKPSKSKISIAFLLFGLILSTLYSFIKEKKSDFIFELDYLLEFLSLNFVEVVNLNLKKSDRFLLLKEFINKQSGEVVNLVLPKNSDIKNFENLRESLNDKNTNKKINLISSPDQFKNLSESNINILVLSRDSITYSQMNSFRDYMQLFKFNLLGLFVINHENE